MTRNLLFLLLVTSLGYTACDDDEPIIENQEEVITSLTLTLMPSSGGSAVTLAFTDPDGDGGDPPVIDVSGPLAANTTYTGSLMLKNESDPGNIEDITAEVQAEDEDHQVFYSVSNGLDLTPVYTDSDDNGNPLGLLTEMVAGASSSGTLTIALIHEPDKTATGVSIGNPAPAGGETDLEVTFAVTIQ